jgi:hypothetical protein
VIHGADPLSSGLLAAEAGSDYFDTDTHYQSLARHLVSALRGGGRFFLVTGDPSANSQALSLALNKLTAPRHAVIGIRCVPEFTWDQLQSVALRIAGQAAIGAATEEAECLASASPLYVLDDLDRLSDGQIKDLYDATLHGDQKSAAAVLLARPGFLARLEEPALHFLKEGLAACLRVQELGDNEGIAFLHNQLLAQRDRRVEARGFRRGILIGLVACGIVVTASLGAFLLWHPTTERVLEAPESAAMSKQPSALRAAVTEAASAVTSPAAPTADPAATLATAPPPVAALQLPEREPESPPPAALPALEHPAARLRLSAAEITTLLGRGDAFLRLGDIASARLFYERAADAGDGLAAMQLGATFDPVFLARLGVRGVVADPGQAVSWYRRARDLGQGEAERRLKILETRPSAESDIRPPISTPSYNVGGR